MLSAGHHRSPWTEHTLAFRHPGVGFFSACSFLGGQRPWEFEVSWWLEPSRFSQPRVGLSRGREEWATASSDHPETRQRLVLRVAVCTAGHQEMGRDLGNLGRELLCFLRPVTTGADNRLGESGSRCLGVRPSAKGWCCCLCYIRRCIRRGWPLSSGLCLLHLSTWASMWYPVCGTSASSQKGHSSPLAGVDCRSVRGTLLIASSPLLLRTGL